MPSILNKTPIQSVKKEEISDQMPDQMSNPWQVGSIQDFYFLKCPECYFNTKEMNIFKEHALGNHPMSFVFFGKPDFNIPEVLVTNKQESCETDEKNPKLPETFVQVKEELPETNLSNIDVSNESGHYINFDIEDKDEHTDFIDDFEDKDPLSECGSNLKLDILIPIPILFEHFYVTIP